MLKKVWTDGLTLSTCPHEKINSYLIKIL